MPQPFHLCPDLGELHAYERLNYVLGQVLGVKDFQQEQVYFLHKARLHNRSLHGYGTVWGLEVSPNGTGKTLELQVSSGLAIDTQGREVLVDALQCANLNTWLAAAIDQGSPTANRDTLTPIAGPGSPLAVYVTLCYHPCQTGAQPILGNPCRTDSGQEGVIQYTRIRNDFELKLLAKPPRQIEEDQVRVIGDLFAKIEIDATATVLNDTATATLVQTLRDSLDDPARIPVSTLRIPAVQARDLLRELLRYWITTTRPTLDKLQNPVLKLLEKIRIDDTIATPPTESEIATQIALFSGALDAYVRTNQLTVIEAIAPVTVSGAIATRYRRAILQYWSSKPESGKTVEDDCILLAAVQFTLAANNTVDESTLKVVNLQRPYLLHTRLLQELLLQGILQGPGGTGPQGSQGNPGIAATITVGTVATGDAGTPANVTNSGDATNAVLNFVLPKGDPGAGGTATPTEITVGTVTTGDPGTAASVTNSGTPTNARLDFVIPRGNPGGSGFPGTAAQISIGTVTTGAPGSNPIVANAGTASNAVLDFTIPQGQQGLSGSKGDPGAGLDQLIIRPNDMLSLPNQRRDEQTPFGEPPAEYGTINGYPALIFQRKTLAAFSTLRPTNLSAGEPLLLRLYCAVGQKKEMRWRISWRWVKALRPGEGIDPAADLSPNAFENDLLDMVFDAPLQLYASKLFPLKSPDDKGDYLLVYLRPEASDDPLYLLMVELRWGKVNE